MNEYYAIATLVNYITWFALGFMLGKPQFRIPVSARLIIIGLVVAISASAVFRVTQPGYEKFFKLNVGSVGVVTK